MTDSHEDPEPASRKGWVRYIYVCTFLVTLSALLWGGFSLILLADIPLSLLIAIVLATAVGSYCNLAAVEQG